MGRTENGRNKELGFDNLEEGGVNISSYYFILYYTFAFIIIFSFHLFVFSQAIHPFSGLVCSLSNLNSMFSEFMYILFELKLFLVFRSQILLQPQTCLDP